MSDNRLPDSEFVARAIFLPAMIDQAGHVSLAAFSLRHNEGYFSVARMAVDGWMKDICGISTTPSRRLGGYCKLNVGDIRSLGFSYGDSVEVTFEVEAMPSANNKSHAGISVLFAESVLKGDRKEMLKPLPEGVSSTSLLMRIQMRLSGLADKSFVVFKEKS